MVSNSQLTWEKEAVNGKKTKNKTSIDSVSITVINKDRKPAK